ncbi:MAG: amidohydrolase [Clostridia bacterium]|nr:amidohydrolase [Clostridia bacterium]MBR5266430.1 amidohydrolase [Clostridia bacterium]
MRIINGKLLTMEGEVFENGYVDFENGKITAFGDASAAPEYNGEVIDAEGGYITPGFIECHCHIGVSEESIRWEGNDTNESTDPWTPHLRGIDAIYPYDKAFKLAVNAGITSACTGPGSGNVIGGQLCAIKLYGTDPDEMVIKAPAAMKMAFGENPKGYFQRMKKSPATRMATAAILREALFKTQQYLRKKEKGDDVFDMKLEAMIPVLKGEIPAHMHAHRADDILTAMRIAKEFGIKFNMIHTSDAVLVKEQLKKNNVEFCMGPTLGVSTKPETKNKTFASYGEVQRYGLTMAITTDHPVLAIETLPVCAMMAVKNGMDEMEALKAITINAAKVANIDERVGSIKVGKDADIVIFDGNPMEIATQTKAVFIDGKKIK